MGTVFISYARTERDRVEALRNALHILGVDTFFDIHGLDAGDSFSDSIDRALKNSKAVLGCWSDHALTRTWVKNECRVGMSKGTLVAIALQRLGDVPVEFAHVQYTDLSGYDGSFGDPEFLKVARSLQKRLGRKDLVERTRELAAVEPISTLDIAEIVEKEHEEVVALWQGLAAAKKNKNALTKYIDSIDAPVFEMIAANRIKGVEFRKERPRPNFDDPPISKRPKPMDPPPEQAVDKFHTEEENTFDASWLFVLLPVVLILIGIAVGMR